MGITQSFLYLGVLNCVVVDIEVTDKFTKHFQKGVALRGCGIFDYTQKWA